MLSCPRVGRGSLVVGGVICSVWYVWRCVVIAIGFCARQFAELKEETQLIHVLSANVCSVDEERQPHQSTTAAFEVSEKTRLAQQVADDLD